MMWWRRMLIGGSASPQATLPLRKLSLSSTPAATYAVGDIHGHFELYKALEAKILEDAAGCDGPVLLVLLGDLIDRGPNSAELIDYLLGPPPPGVTRVTLRGNHEDMFLQVLHNPLMARDWVSWGGAQTLASYGIHPGGNGTYDFGSSAFRRALAAKVPESHRAFLEETPICLNLPDWFLSHAGVNAAKAFEGQSKEDLLWGDPRGLQGKSLSKCVIHGHVPVPHVELSNAAINVDTGAYRTGCLSAVRLVAGEAPVVLQVSRPETMKGAVTQDCEGRRAHDTYGYA
ncbi:metallophosphoesterase [Celeribacter sp. ULVN23_4]